MSSPKSPTPASGDVPVPVPVPAPSNVKVLFVCVGNSCRSPMAESVCRHVAADLGQTDWHVDSAGIADWNVGRLPEPRALQLLSEKGLKSEHVTRQIQTDDFYKFDYIFGMDDYNVHDLKELAPADSKACIEHLAFYDYGQPRVIADPYFDYGMVGFENAYVQIERSCTHFVKRVLDLEPEYKPDFVGEAKEKIRQFGREVNEMMEKVENAGLIRNLDEYKEEDDKAIEMLQKRKAAPKPAKANEEEQKAASDPAKDLK